MRTFRKFLLGQCCKIIHLKEPFTGFQMSTKKVFDDMYLYLQDIHRQYQEGLKRNKEQATGRGPRDNRTERGRTSSTDCPPRAMRTWLPASGT